ncbi:hypothetical protein KC866_03165 [Patescibacteria group bacterium]|nr:hypothetical protein [Patescibacteria group bacterium]
MFGKNFDWKVSKLQESLDTMNKVFQNSSISDEKKNIWKRLLDQLPDNFLQVDEHHVLAKLAEGIELNDEESMARTRFHLRTSDMYDHLYKKGNSENLEDYYTFALAFWGIETILKLKKV